MTPLQTDPLFELRLDIGAREHIGTTPFGDRMAAHIPSGQFEGPRLRGRVLPSSGDWPLSAPNGAIRIDARVTLETDDGALIYMSYRGVRHASLDVLARIQRGEDIDPSEYYFRTAAMFETAAAPYDWLNFIVAIGLGRRAGNGIIYDVRAVL